MLHAHARAELLVRIADLKAQPKRLLDLGAGTGLLSAALKSRYRRADLTAVDLAPAMLKRAAERQRLWSRYRLVCAEASALPFAAQAFDLVASNLMLHWVVEPAAVFAELRRVMQDGAPLCFATLGPDTLCELRAAYAALDGREHVNRLLDMHDLGDALARAGFVDPVLDVERVTLTYPRLEALLADLRATGSTALAQPGPGLAGAERRRALARAYAPFRRDGRLPATCEIIYGLARRGPARAPGGAGEVAIAVTQVARRRRPV